MKHGIKEILPTWAGAGILILGVNGEIMKFVVVKTWIIYRLAIF